MSDLEVWTLDEDLVMPFIAGWRVMERSLNPAMSMIIKCNKCGKVSTAQQDQGPAFVLSKKKKNGMPIIIGIQCYTEGCGMVIKFGRQISPADSDFPSRLQKKPPSALTDPQGKAGKKLTAKGLEEVESLLELGKK